MGLKKNARRPAYVGDPVVLAWQPNKTAAIYSMERVISEGHEGVYIVPDWYMAEAEAETETESAEEP